MARRSRSVLLYDIGWKRIGRSQRLKKFTEAVHLMYCKKYVMLWVNGLLWVKKETITISRRTMIYSNSEVSATKPSKSWQFASASARKKKDRLQIEADTRIGGSEVRVVKSGRLPRPHHCSRVSGNP